MDSSEADALGNLIGILLPVAFLGLWWFIGRTVERRHLASLAAREALLREMLVTTLDRFPGGVEGESALVTGEAVIASDYFKTTLFSLRNIFGGESVSFARLFDRARREAVLRMAASAREHGYDAVCNVRFSTSDIGGNAGGGNKKKVLPMAVCLVSGTAYRRTRA